jgi:hypothetical protein
MHLNESFPRRFCGLIPRCNSGEYFAEVKTSDSSCTQKRGMLSCRCGWMTARVGRTWLGDGLWKGDGRSGVVQFLMTTLVSTFRRSERPVVATRRGGGDKAYRLDATGAALAKECCRYKRPTSERRSGKGRDGNAWWALFGGQNVR